MKENILKLILVLSLFSTSEIASGNTADGNGTTDSPVEISLLTCSPHDEVYSLYGHTAIRYKDRSSGTDIAINYGVFSFKKPYFVLRFIFGLTDYEMGIEEFSSFCEEYRYYGCKVTQQVINLTDDEKARIALALQKNYENDRVYRYNYLYNNCTTKARDIILSSINGKVRFSNAIDEKQSFRKIIHLCNGNYRWARFGNDLLLGCKADFTTTRDEQQFLPANLLRDFSHAEIIDKNGKSRPLVKSTQVLLTGNGKALSEKTKITPLHVFLLLLITTLAICVIERRTGKKFILFDFAVLSASGIGGIILFLMLFSHHPTTSTNFQILILNPLSLYFAIYLIRNRRNRKKEAIAWKVLAAFFTIGLLARLFQDYAEGITLLASSLLLRGFYNLYVAKKEK